MENLSKKILYIVLDEQKRQGIDTRELAQKMDCSYRAIVYWKKGERNISLQMAEKVLRRGQAAGQWNLITSY